MYGLKDTPIQTCSHFNMQIPCSAYISIYWHNDTPTFPIYSLKDIPPRKHFQFHIWTHATSVFPFMDAVTFPHRLHALSIRHTQWEPLSCPYMDLKVSPLPPFMGLKKCLHLICMVFKTHPHSPYIVLKPYPLDDALICIWGLNNTSTSPYMGSKASPYPRLLSLLTTHANLCKKCDSK